MFKNNKYTHIYYSIVNNGKSRTLEGYYEKHHIIPRCLGGLDNNDNIVCLTAREHFLCHWLLIKMTTDDAYYKMIHAWFAMSRRDRNQKRYHINARTYEYMKNRLAEARRYTNQKRRYLPLTDMTKKKISQSLKKHFITEKGTFTGKKHSKESCKKISQKLKEYHKIKTYKDSFKIIYPNGEVEIIGCLTHWAKKNKLSIETLKDSYRKNRRISRGPARGLQVIKL